MNANTNVVVNTNTNTNANEEVVMNTNTRIDVVVVNMSIAKCNDMCDTLDNMFIDGRYMMKEVLGQTVITGTLGVQQRAEIKYQIDDVLMESYNNGGLMHDYVMEPEMYMGEFSEYYDVVRAEVCTNYIMLDKALTTDVVPF